MEKKGRKTIREKKKDKTIPIRLTADEKEIFELYAKTQNSKVAAMIIKAVYRDMLTHCWKIPIETIHKLGLPIKQHKSNEQRRANKGAGAETR